MKLSTWLRNVKGRPEHIPSVSIPDTWYRMAGIHLENDGTVGAAWLAYDKDSDKVHVYECALFKDQDPLMIAGSINAHGMWIPIAWPKEAKDFADMMLNEYGCNMLPEEVVNTQSMVEVISRKVSERAKTSRLGAHQRLIPWFKEYDEFKKQESQVPLEGYPLMSATRHAVVQLDYAKRQSKSRKTLNYPKTAII